MHARDHLREVGAVRTGLLLASILCLTEALGGYFTNSLALVSDAVHVMGDVGALGLTLFALWVGARPASESKTFGYYRAEVLAALVSGVILWVVGIVIVAEAWQRLQAPPEVAGPGMLAVAAVGLAVNVFVAHRLREHQAHSLNLRGAYLHVLSDMLGSIGAVVAGVAIVVGGWQSADALASLLIVALIVFGSWTLVREAVDVLMEAVPAHIDVETLPLALQPLPRPHDLPAPHLCT